MSALTIVALFEDRETAAAAVEALLDNAFTRGDIDSVTEVGPDARGKYAEAVPATFSSPFVAWEIWVNGPCPSCKNIDRKQWKRIPFPGRKKDGKVSKLTPARLRSMPSTMLVPTMKRWKMSGKSSR